MSETYEKIDDNTLRITRNTNEIHITEQNRAEIQTQLDHLELDESNLQRKVDELRAKIAILDA